MLNIYFDKQKLWDRIMKAPDSAFQFIYKKEWSTNKFTKRIVEEIEGAKYVAPNICESEDYGIFALKDISGGGKCLIYLANQYPCVIMSHSMGDNCARLLCDISSEVDCNILFTHPFKFVDDQIAYFPEYDETHIGRKDIFLSALPHYNDWYPEV